MIQPMIDRIDAEVEDFSEELSDEALDREKGPVFNSWNSKCLSA